jgi:hypothetical protein
MVSQANPDSGALVFIGHSCVISVSSKIFFGIIQTDEILYIIM